MEWIYSAVIVAILSGMFGIGVGVMVIRRVIRTREFPRPVVTWLLGAMTTLAVVQVIEQSRVLIFRLSFDGLVDGRLFGAVYGATWNVAPSKLLAAMALTVAAAVKLGLYLDRPEQVIIRWGLASAVSAVAIWAFIAVLLDRMLP